MTLRSSFGSFGRSSSLELARRAARCRPRPRRPRPASPRGPTRSASVSISVPAARSPVRAGAARGSARRSPRAPCAAGPGPRTAPGRRVDAGSAMRASTSANSRSSASSRSRIGRGLLVAEPELVTDLGQPVVRLALLLRQVEALLGARRRPDWPASCSMRCRTSSSVGVSEVWCAHGRSAASASRSASSWSSSSLPRLSMSSSIARPYFIQRVRVPTPPSVPFRCRASRLRRGRPRPGAAARRRAPAVTGWTSRAGTASTRRAPGACIARSSAALGHEVEVHAEGAGDHDRAAVGVDAERRGAAAVLEVGAGQGRLDRLEVVQAER